MKHILETYTSYNFWANAKLTDVLKSIDPSLIDKEVASSFNSIRKTTYHTWGAEELWWKRLHGESLSKVPAMDFSGSYEKAVKHFLSVSKKITELVKEKDENYLQTPNTYKDTRGNSWTNTHWQMIMHCMNHSTFHRGQLITMMRAVGVTIIPATDMIVYFREQKK
ncbi:MAG: DinB family protein [Bacteroidetes bacterium]|nr:DinB family protein [Bacteroidota bacterium]